MSNEKTHYIQRNDSGETVGKENKLKILIGLNPSALSISLSIRCVVPVKSLVGEYDTVKQTSLPLSSLSH